MKAIVTGGAGFIGSHLTDLLIQRGLEVLVIDNLSCGRIENINHLKTNKNFSFKNVDILNFDELNKCFKNVDWVFHLAGLADIVPSIENPKDYYEVNVTGTLNVLECSRKANVKRFIYAASSSCYGVPERFPTSESSKISPEYPYALTKFLGEELVCHWNQLYKLPTISLRLFNVYGLRSRTSGTYGAVFGVFLAQKFHKMPYTIVGDGEQTRDFTYVTDVANAFYTAAESNISGEIMNVGSSKHYSINRLVELLEGEKVFIPKRPGEPDCTFADVSKIERLLGWKAKVSFEQGVKKMLERLDFWSEAPVWNPKTIEKATNKWFEHLGND
jgi:UDP-glucose 4-epimerase